MEISYKSISEIFGKDFHLSPKYDDFHFINCNCDDCQPQKAKQFYEIQNTKNYNNFARKVYWKRNDRRRLVIKKIKKIITSDAITHK